MITMEFLVATGVGWTTACGLYLLLRLSWRLLPHASERWLGVLTAILGVPVFLIHLMWERRLW